jgi:general secretion pathway protein I
LFRSRVRAFSGKVVAGFPQKMRPRNRSKRVFRFDRIEMRSRSRAGFTLIEALVALAVVAASLSAIGALVATSLHGVRSIEERLAFRETLRAIVTSLPARRDLDARSGSGELAGYRWRAEIAPLTAGFVEPQAPTVWEPESIAISVRGPSGQVVRINTIRLRRRAK